MSTEELKKLLEEKNQVKVINKGIGPLSLLGIAFVVMKIMGYITWSWWWVLAPFWIPVAIAVTLIAILMFFLVLLVSKGLGNVKVKETVTTIKKEEPVEKTTKRTKKSKKDGGTGTKGENG